jgi:CRP/FNR family transcriptional regulator, cyclic AMP receptor protein
VADAKHRRRMSQEAAGPRRRLAGAPSQQSPISKSQQSSTRRADILAQLSPDDRELMLSRCTEVKFRRGTHLFLQGSRHTENFFIKAGVIRTYYVSPGGKEFTLAYWSAGDLLGGPDFFGKTYHIWSALAVEDASALAIDCEDFAEITVMVPSIARAVIDTLVFKLTWLSVLLQIQGTASVYVRLAHLLLKLSEMFGQAHPEGTVIEHGFTQADLANMIGATRQRVSMTLNRLRQQRIVRIGKRRLVILDQDNLRRISEI